MASAAKESQVELLEIQANGELHAPHFANNRRKSVLDNKVTVQEQNDLLDGDLKKLREVMAEKQRTVSPAQVEVLLQELPYRASASLAYQDQQPDSGTKHEELFSLVDQRSVVKLREYLEDMKSRFGADFLVTPNFRLPGTKATALHHALEQDFLETARVLTKFSSDEQLLTAELELEVCGVCTRITPFQMAVLHGHEDFCLHMLQNVCKNSKQRHTVILKSTLLQIEGQRPRDTNAFHIAALRGMCKLIAFILDMQVRVDSTNRKLDTPLLFAVRGDSQEAVTLLLSRGADVNHKNDKGSSPLHWAVRYNFEGIVKILLHRKADVNVKRSLGLESPTICAAALGYKNILKMLLEAGAWQEIQNKKGETPLHFAAASGHNDVVNLLLDHKANVHQRDDRGNSPLFKAALHGHGDTIKVLIEAGASILDTNGAGESVWDAAIKCDSLYSLHSLIVLTSKQLPKGFKLEKEVLSFPPMTTPLHIAAIQGDLEKINYLINAGVNPLCKDPRGNTFLHAAATHNKVEVLEKYGTTGNLNVGNDDDETCLHVAVRRGAVDVVERIIENSILHRQNQMGRNPLHIAAASPLIPAKLCGVLVAQMAKKHTWTVLEQKDNRGNTALHLAAQGGSCEVIRELKTLNLSARNDQENLPLHIAVKLGHSQAAIMLADFMHNSHSCVDINAENARGDTALMIASEEGDAAVIKKLVFCNAELFHRNKRGVTALHHLIEASAQRISKDVFQMSFDTLVEMSPLWLCNSLNIRFPVEDTSLVAKYRSLALTLLIDTRVDDQGLTVLQKAGHCGASAALQILFDAHGVRKDFKEHNGKITAEYDVSDTTPETLTDELLELEALATECRLDDVATEALQDFGLTKLKKGFKKRSLLDVIFDSNLEQDLVAEMLELTPLKQVVQNYFGVYQIVYILMMIAHIIYMAFFSTLATAELPVFNHPNQTAFNQTDTSSAHILALLAWPVLLLVHLLLYFVMILCQENLGCQNISNKSENCTPARGLHFIWTWICKHLFNTDWLGIVFVSSTLAWIILWKLQNSNQDYVLAFALCSGWLYTINFTQGFQSVHNLSIILKAMLTRDIVRFLVIYIFILLAFSYAVRSLFAGSFLLSSEYSSASSVILLVLNWMLGLEEYLNEDYQEDLRNAGRSLIVLQIFYLVYIVLGVVIMLNLLIAIMNQSYSELESRRATVYRIHSLSRALQYENFFGCLRAIASRCRRLTTTRTLSFNRKLNRYFLVVSPNAVERGRYSSDVRKELAELRQELGHVTQLLSQQRHSSK